VSFEVSSSRTARWPKVDAACRFVEATGGTAAIGALEDATKIVAGLAGTLVVPARPA
jgi:carbamate kinase